MHQASDIMCIFYRIEDLFFSVRVSCQQGKGEGIFLAPLYHFHLLCQLFGLQHFHLSEKFNDERGLCKWIQELYYIFLLSKPLDLLLNISFQPLIIVVKHSIIKLEVIATKSTTSIYPMRKSMTILLCEYNFRFES